MNRFGRTALAAATLATALSACSTRPRNFAASVSTPVADRVAFEQDYRVCESLVRGGRKSGFRNVAGGAAAGAGAAGAGVSAFAASTGGTASGWGGVGAGLGTAAAAATLVVGVAGFGLTRLIRGGRERSFKDRMESCLSEYGYEVADWEKLKKREDAAAFASRGVAVSDPVPAVPVLIEAVVVEETPQPAETMPETVALLTPEG